MMSRDDQKRRARRAAFFYEMNAFYPTEPALCLASTIDSAKPPVATVSL